MRTLNIITNYDTTASNISNLSNKKECEKLLKYFQQLFSLSAMQEKDNRSYLSEEEDKHLTIFFKALYMIDEKEREVLRYRYVELDENSRLRFDYEVVRLLNVSERTYFRIKAMALENYGKALRMLGLWVILQQQSQNQIEEE